MLSRIENKYLVDDSQITEFYKLINDKNFKEIFVKRKINSIYFDNKFFESYSDSEEGSVPRKKIRLRFYGEKNIYMTQKVFLEKKITTIQGKFKTVEEKLNFKDYLEEGLVDNNYGICYPKLTISYYREYFQKKNIRITFDSLIEYENLDVGLNSMREKSNIMEIKCLNVENNDFIEKNFPLQKIRFSKYCSGINSLKLCLK